MSSPEPTPGTSSSRGDVPPVGYRRAVTGLVVSLLGAWLLMMLPLPWSIASGVFGLVGAVYLVVTVVQAWKARRVMTAVISAVVGLPACLLIVLGAVTSALFYQPMHELEECRASALTHEAQTQCQEQAESSMTSWLTSLLGS